VGRKPESIRSFQLRQVPLDQKLIGDIACIYAAPLRPPTHKARLTFFKMQRVHELKSSTSLTDGAGPLDN
jgi:hypothetical protein